MKVRRILEILMKGRLEVLNRLMRHLYSGKTICAVRRGHLLMLLLIDISLFL